MKTEMQQQIIRCNNLCDDLKGVLNAIDYDRLFVLMDESTCRFCLPLLLELPEIQSAGTIVLKAGDDHKNIEAITAVWKYLSENKATRKSLLINLGGGMITDLGGFAAASFKRGIRFVNIPTTLLGAVDAAIGGKTGINFNGLKNEIGAFAPADAVLIESTFFKSLDDSNLLSGYAEMLKHGLLSSEVELNELLAFDLEKVDYEHLKDLLFRSVLIKENVVKQDPKEQGLRKALNLGHTIGHAFESFSYEINQPILHGYAVAWGIICELYLSYVQQGFDKKIMMDVIRFIKENYGVFIFDCSQYDRLYELMQHDKKNETGFVNFTLLSAVGEVVINQTAGKKEIEEALDFYRDI